jgi:hypothetical protein
MRSIKLNYIRVLLLISLILAACEKSEPTKVITHANAVDEVVINIQKLKDDPTKSRPVLAGLRIINKDLAQQKELLQKLDAHNTPALVDLLVGAKADANIADSLELVLAWENIDQQVTKNTWSLLQAHRPKKEILKNFCLIAAQIIFLRPSELNNFDTKKAACILSSMPESKSKEVVVNLQNKNAQDLRAWAILNAHRGEGHPVFKRLYKFSGSDDIKKDMRNKALLQAYTNQPQSMLLFAKDLKALGLTADLKKNSFKLDDFEGSFLWALAKKIQKDSAAGINILKKEDLESISAYIKKIMGDTYVESVEKTKFGPHNETVLSIILGMGADKTLAKLILNIDDFDVTELLAELTRLINLNPAADDIAQKRLARIFKIAIKTSQDAEDLSHNKQNFLDKLMALKATPLSLEILTNFLAMLNTQQKKSDAVSKLVNNKNALEILADNNRRSDVKYSGEDALSLSYMIVILVHNSELQDLKKIKNLEEYKNILDATSALGSVDDLSKVFTSLDISSDKQRALLAQWVIENSQEKHTAEAFKKFNNSLVPDDVRKIRSEIFTANNLLNSADKKNNRLSFINDDAWGINSAILDWAGAFLNTLVQETIVELKAAQALNDTVAEDAVLDDVRTYAAALKAKIADPAWYNKLITQLMPGATEAIRDALKAALGTRQDLANFYLVLDDFKSLMKAARDSSVSSKTLKSIYDLVIQNNADAAALGAIKKSGFSFMELLVKDHDASDDTAAMMKDFVDKIGKASNAKAQVACALSMLLNKKASTSQLNKRAAMLDILIKADIDGSLRLALNDDELRKLIEHYFDQNDQTRFKSMYKKLAADIAKLDPLADTATIAMLRHKQKLMRSALLATAYGIDDAERVVRMNRFFGRNSVKDMPSDAWGLACALLDDEYELAHAVGYPYGAAPAAGMLNGRLLKVLIERAIEDQNIDDAGIKAFSYYSSARYKALESYADAQRQLLSNVKHYLALLTSDSLPKVLAAKAQAELVVEPKSALAILRKALKQTNPGFAEEILKVLDSRNNIAGINEGLVMKMASHPVVTNAKLYFAFARLVPDNITAQKLAARKVGKACAAQAESDSFMHLLARRGADDGAGNLGLPNGYNGMIFELYFNLLGPALTKVELASMSGRQTPASILAQEPRVILGPDQDFLKQLKFLQDELSVRK